MKIRRIKRNRSTEKVTFLFEIFFEKTNQMKEIFALFTAKEKLLKK